MKLFLLSLVVWVGAFALVGGGGRQLQAQGPQAAAPTTLTEIARNPAAWRGVEVEFVLQFAAEHETWHWWTTRFQPDQYVGFAAWGDEQLLWEKYAFDHPEPHLFAARGSRAAVLLAETQTYRRYQVRAVVRTIFAGRPWIEVLSATPLERSLGEGTILHAARAYELLDAGSPVAAREQFERALAAPMPQAMRAVLEAARNSVGTDAD